MNDISPISPLLSPTPASLPQRSSLKHVESFPSRQHRLLRSRDAKFPGKRLSSPNLTSSIACLSLQQENALRVDHRFDDQENTPPTKEEYAHSLKRNHSLPSLESLKDTSGSAQSPSPRSCGNTPINERYCTETTSNFPSPVMLNTRPVWGKKLIGVSHTNSNPETTQLREVSGNRQRSSSSKYSQSGSTKHGRKQKLHRSRLTFDTDEYINHIEQELQQAKEAVYSPTSNKSLKDQLKSVRAENARLRHDIDDIRHTFETEVQRTVEHKTAVEIELKRRVKTLECEVERKEIAIRDLEYDYEEKRLDGNAIETLKSTIERLEHEKTAMLDENRSLSKRNEVLSQLLAMSPTKAQATIELRSPIREKRGGRPMSMIIPRVPSSPVISSVRSQPNSAIASPSLHAAVTTSCVPGLSPESSLGASSVCSNRNSGLHFKNSSSLQLMSKQKHGAEHVASEVSTIDNRDAKAADPSAIALPLSPLDDESMKPMMKRKPRKFMSGSTQLKPLLLPALASDGNSQLSGSILASPQSAMSREFSGDQHGQTYYFAPQSSGFPASEVEQDTIMPECLVDFHSVSTGPDRCYQTFEEILAEQHLADSVPTGERHHFISSPSSLYDDEFQCFHARPKSLVGTRSQVFDYHNSLRSQCQSTDFKAQLGAERDSGPDSFDLDGFQDPRLARPRFDAYPRPTRGADQRLLEHIPQPLFSPLSYHQGAQQDGGHSGIVWKHNECQYPLGVSNPRKRAFPGSVHDTNLVSPSSRASDPWSSSPFLHVATTQSPPLHRNSNLRVKPSKLFLSPSASSMYLERAKSPLGLLQHNHFGARPLAALTIRALYGTISQCTAYVRDFKRDPLALARRVIANAWLSNWSRLGKLSWWVLGLFIPQVLPQQHQQWEWEDYDGEAVARRYCEAEKMQNDRQLACTNNGHNIPSSLSDEDVSRNQRLNHKRTGWGSSLILWGKFSVAIMLAVGGAVVKGPGEMLKDTDHRVSGWPAKRNREACRHHRYRTSETPAPVSGVSGISNHSRAKSLFTFRSPKELFADRQVPGESLHDRDGTLRPSKSQKKHAADVFSPDEPGYRASYADISSYNVCRGQIEHQTESTNISTLTWPPETDDIHPDDSASITGFSSPFMR